MNFKLGGNYQHGAKRVTHFLGQEQKPEIKTFMLDF